MFSKVVVALYIYIYVCVFVLFVNIGYFGSTFNSVC